MEDLSISIYVPVYNGEKTIKKCIDGILNQTLKTKKILVVNDSSTDKTKKILESYKDQIEVLDNKKNLGISLTRDIAVNHLKTDYIASIDADVELDKNWLKIIYESIIKNNATWVCGKMYEKYTHNSFNLWRSLRLKQHWGEKSLSNPNLIFGCNNILKTSSLNKEKIYKNYGEYFKTNGDENILTKYLKDNNHMLYYESKAVCYHLLNDNHFTLSHRYWRYMLYGDGLKKRNLFKTIKNIVRQIKKTLKWSVDDILKLRFKLIKVNFIILYYFCKIDFEFFKKNKDG
tara:strand:+ start:1197 stop:2060 length:864 start_codon:yes stop_codon:yes gene_type:complete